MIRLLSLLLFYSKRILYIYRAPEEGNTWTNSFGRLLGSVAYYLPKQTSEVLTQDRSFATVHLQTAETKTIVAMNM